MHTCAHPYTHSGTHSHVPYPGLGLILHDQWQLDTQEIPVQGLLTSMSQTLIVTIVTVHVVLPYPNPQSGAHLINRTKMEDLNMQVETV